MENEKKTRKARKAKVTLVQLRNTNDTWSDEVADSTDTASAIQWIKDNGYDGQIYRVVTVQFEGKLTRTPVTTEKVSFA